MHLTQRNATPFVITMLSPSPAASRRLQQVLAKWTPGLFVEEERDWGSDNLNNLMTFPKMRFHSISIGNESLKLHFLSSQATKGEGSGMWSLLAVNEAPNIGQARDGITNFVRTKMSYTRLAWSAVRKTPVSADCLLGASKFPILSWNGTYRTSPSPSSQQTDGTLKEIVLPISHGSKLTCLVTLEKPVTGLYQLPGSSVCLRPLPLGKEDRASPPTSLVFHVDCLDQVMEERDREDDVVTDRIGFTATRQGQVMLRYPMLAPGLDLRLCESRHPCTFFNEAQESLLAGSLSELQSTKVIDMNRSSDFRTNNGDCWVEFKANVTNPSGYFRNKSETRVARASDLPPD